MAEQENFNHKIPSTNIWAHYIHFIGVFFPPNELDSLITEVFLVVAPQKVLGDILQPNLYP